MAYTAALPRRATSQASATASSSVGLPFTGTRIRTARITALHFLALRCGWVKRAPSDAQPAGGAQQSDDAHAVLDAAVHRRFHSGRKRHGPRDEVMFGSI